MTEKTWKNPSRLPMEFKLRIRRLQSLGYGKNMNEIIKQALSRELDRLERELIRKGEV